jgi:hypothetical protein
MIRKLPTFNGYTVDARLREFRKADPDHGLDFIPFESPEGQELLDHLMDHLDGGKPDDRALIAAIWL